MMAVLGMLGALLCVLAVRADLMPPADFNLQKMEGKWYVVGMATNAEWFTNHKSKMNMGVSMMTPQPNGDLDLDSAYPNTDGSCKKMNFLAQKTDTPGKFFFRSQRWQNDNEVVMVEVQYDEYALSHITKTKAGSSYVLTKLYSRKQNVKPEILDKFTQFSRDQGILNENIVILPKAEECS